MARIIQSFIYIGRWLSDLTICVCIVLILTFLILPISSTTGLNIVAAILGIYLLGLLFYRLSFRNNQYLASKRRIANSSQWAQSFIMEQLSEIRRPLQGLIGVREVYDFNFENKDTQEYMEIVNHCSEHVVRLINRIQLYSELKAGKPVCKEVRFTLTNILQESLDVAEASNPGKKIKVDQHISPKVLRDYYGHYDLIRTLIVELVDNAIRFSPKSDIELSADTSYEDSHNLVIRIRDTGPGLGEKKQKELQTLFDRNTIQSDLQYCKDGMGIPLIRGLAKTLSSRIKINSKKGEGTEVEVHLRLAAYNSHMVDLKKKNAKIFSNQILIVEDDPLAQKIVSAMLNRLGYRSTIVSNGHDAIEICRRQKFGLILMDLEMPVMDGWEASEHIIKSCKKDEEPLIVALTARNSPADRARAKKVGCSHFLPKPISRDQLKMFLNQAGISPHFLPNTYYSEDKFDGLEMLAGKTLNFNKVLAHYDRDMKLCQMIIKQTILSLPNILDSLDSSILKRDQKATKECLHQMKGEFRALLCNAGVHLVERLESHSSADNIDFISDLEQLNRYTDSLLNELSVLSKHNESFV